MIFWVVSGFSRSHVAPHHSRTDPPSSPKTLPSPVDTPPTAACDGVVAAEADAERPAVASATIADVMTARRRCRARHEAGNFPHLGSFQEFRAVTTIGPTVPGAPDERTAMKVH